LALYTTKKGLNLPLEGEATLEWAELSDAETVSVETADFPFQKFRVLVQEGDAVEAGAPVLASKINENIVFTAPVAGTISSVRRGERRALLGIDIKVSGEDAIDFGAWDENKIKSASADDVYAHLLQSGMWPLVRQRPFSKIADPAFAPKAIFVNGMNSGPHNPPQDFLCQGREKELQAGVEALRRFQEKLFLISSPENAKFFANINNTEQHQFSGPHPSGLVSTHIAELAPINKGDTVWYITAYQLTLIGEYLLNGKVPTRTIAAITGSNAQERKFAKVLRGSKMSSVVSVAENSRVISGDVLTGQAKGIDGYLGYYDQQITCIPEGGEQYYLLSDKHWAGAGANSFSVHNLFLSRLFGKKSWKLDTSVNGGERAIIQNGLYEQYVPLDIYVTFLVKACIAGDVERMEELGILEIDSEDVALCTVVCPSKVEVSEVIRKGLALIEKEG
jgi:Na+-transporting NADH:ubiquinone oxidoreductase subunit A